MDLWGGVGGHRIGDMYVRMLLFVFYILYIFILFRPDCLGRGAHEAALVGPGRPNLDQCLLHVPPSPNIIRCRKLGMAAEGLHPSCGHPCAMAPSVARCMVAYGSMVVVNLSYIHTCALAPR